MNRRTLVRMVLIGILTISIATSAFAYVNTVMIFYYSDSGFINEVGWEIVPGVCCFTDEYESFGNTETTYRRIQTYDYCGLEQQNADNCQSYYSGAWHMVSCY